MHIRHRLNRGCDLQYVDTTVNALRGFHFKFVIIQDAVGRYAFAWPSICKGALPIGQGKKQTTIQTFILLHGPTLRAILLPAIF